MNKPLSLQGSLPGVCLASLPPSVTTDSFPFLVLHSVSVKGFCETKSPSVPSPTTATRVKTDELSHPGVEQVALVNERLRTQRGAPGALSLQDK